MQAFPHAVKSSHESVLWLVAGILESCELLPMPAHWASPVKRRLKDTVLAVALALALYIGAGVPGLQPGVAAAAPAMAAIDCPMQDKRDAETSLGCCILCSMPSLVTASGTDPFIIPLRLSLGAALPFATGVSATHGPALTANLATGPPVA